MAIIFKDAINVTGNSTFNSNVTVSNTLTAGTVNAQTSTISDSASFEGDVDFTEASVEGLSAGDVGLSGGISGTKFYYAPGSSSGSFVQKAVTLSNGIVTSWAT
jgi:predicted aconitase with swiveling domain